MSKHAHGICSLLGTHRLQPCYNPNSIAEKTLMSGTRFTFREVTEIFIPALFQIFKQLTLDTNSKRGIIDPDIVVRCSILKLRHSRSRRGCYKLSLNLTR